MEIHFSEVDNYNNNQFQNNSQENNSKNFDKYWKQETPSSQKTEQKKKKVSFDDILNHMNLVVNNSGELQFMTNASSYTQRNDNNEIMNTHSRFHESVSVNKNIPIVEPEVKHSYIYNKYFKNYIDVNNKQTPEVKVPKTMAEYKQMVIEEQIRVFNEKQRISKIKSKKLLFTNAGNITATKNTLYNMKFH